MSTAALKLPATLATFIAAQVEQGAYRSRRDAIIAAVAGEKRRVGLRTRLTEALQKGLDSGTGVPLNMEDLIRRGSARLRAGQ